MSRSLRDEIVNGTESVYPKSSDARADAEEKVANADMLVLTDGDADGVSAAALVDYVFSDHMHIEMFPVGPHRPVLWKREMLEILEEYGRKDMTVFFLDTSLSGSPDWVVSPLEDLDMNIQFFDHHLWPDKDRYEYVKQHTTHCEVNPMLEDPPVWEINGETIEDRCTVQMVYDYFVRNGVDFPEEIEERVKGVAAGDLWLRKDGEFLHSYTELLIDSIEYITDIQFMDRVDEEWYGYREWADAFVDTDTELEDTVLRDYAESYREYLDQLMEFIHNNSEDFMTKKTVGDVELVAIYGDVPPNDLAEALREEGYGGIAFVYPSKRVSFRGAEDKFEVCQEVADSLGGGGHELAAGAGLDDLVEDVTDQEHQESHGEEAREKVLERMAEFLE